MKTKVIAPAVLSLAVSGCSLFWPSDPKPEPLGKQVAALRKADKIAGEAINTISRAALVAGEIDDVVGLSTTARVLRLRGIVDGELCFSTNTLVWEPDIDDARAGLPARDPLQGQYAYRWVDSLDEIGPAAPFDAPMGDASEPRITDETFRETWECEHELDSCEPGSGGYRFDYEVCLPAPEVSPTARYLIVELLRPDDPVRNNITIWELAD